MNPKRPSLFLPRLLRPFPILAACLILTGCGQREAQIEQAAREQLMLVGNSAEPSDLDPHTVTGVPEDNIISTLFEGLTRLDPETLEARPGVAERWDISADGLVYVFHLRSDVRWSDGTPLTARDFHASFRRILSPALGSDNADQMYPVINAESYHKGTLKEFNDVGFRVVDDRTLEIRLRHPAAFLLQSVASRSWIPVPMHVLEKFGPIDRPGNRWTRPGNLVSNGPFMLHAWLPNQHVEVRRNPAYWNAQAVRLNGVRFVPIESRTSEEAAFRAGQLHRTQHVPLNKLPIYQRETPELLQIHPYSGVYYFNFNVNRAPFDDVRVRQAFAMAVDRESLVRNITLGGETPAYHFTLEGVGNYVSRSRTKLDFDEARRLLAEAGYPGGVGMPPITLLYNTAENHRAIAEAVQQTWKRELGVTMTLENQEWRVYLDSMSQGNFQISRAGLIMDPFDPSQFLKVFLRNSGFNRTGWSDPDYDRLYEEVMQTTDVEKRLELMQQMEKILTDAMPILPVYYYVNQFLMRPSVRGWTNNLIALGPYDRTWLD